MVEGKHIVVGVSSSVAIYKALELVRLFKKNGAAVQVVMTPHASQLISPQLFQAVSGNPVHVKLFTGGEGEAMPHVGSLNEADLFVLAPATASLIGRYAMGLATDLLTTSLLATRAPVLIAPAMNTLMWTHPLVQQHVARLRSIGVRVLDPEKGELACGVYGAGHLPNLGTIYDEALRLLTPQDWAGQHVLISMGPTWEPIDPVRGILNRSSGRMGLALAREAWQRGARVTLVTGPTSRVYPELDSFQVIVVETAVDMHKAVLAHFSACNVFISAAAVADYAPKPFTSKLKKNAMTVRLTLYRTPDILRDVLDQKRPNQHVVGFCLESDALEANMTTKWHEKPVDVLVGNSPCVLGKEKGDFQIWTAREHRALRGSKRDVAHFVYEALSELKKNHF